MTWCWTNWEQIGFAHQFDWWIGFQVWEKERSLGELLVFWAVWCLYRNGDTERRIRPWMTQENHKHLDVCSMWVALRYPSGDLLVSWVCELRKEVRTGDVGFNMEKWESWSMVCKLNGYIRSTGEWVNLERKRNLRTKLEVYSFRAQNKRKYLERKLRRSGQWEVKK